MLILSLRSFSVLCAGALLLCVGFAARSDEIQAARALYKQGQFADALQKVDGILTGRPKDEQARFLKGLILSEQGNAGEAIRIFTALTEDYPQSPEPYNNLAVLLANQEQYDKARVVLEKALHTNPSYATAYENLGNVYSQMASQAYTRALPQNLGGRNSPPPKLALIDELPEQKRAVRTAVAAAKPAAAAPSPVAENPVGKPVAEQVAPAVLPLEKTGGATEQPAAVPQQGKTQPAAVQQSGDGPAQALQSWAAAWSAKNVRAYLSYYAPGFRTPNGESRKEWEAQRKMRVSKPGPIHVVLSDLHVKMIDEDHASVTCVQFYRSLNLKATGNKKIEMVRTGGRWLILDEWTGR